MAPLYSHPAVSISQVFRLTFFSVRQERHGGVPWCFDIVIHSHIAELSSARTILVTVILLHFVIEQTFAVIMFFCGRFPSRRSNS